MEQTNALRSKIEELLKTISDYVTDNGELKYNIVKEDAQNGDVRLLGALLKNETLKDKFFKPVLDSLVFDTHKFCQVLEYASGCNSYSKYLGKKIGLYFGDKALTDCSDVVLNFPFKDCVLEGGQTKEDGEDTYYDRTDLSEKHGKRREVFYNEILAQDEIDSLFAPKAFCNAKRYDANGTSEQLLDLQRDAEINRSRNLPDDTITDNLIIKGNNLLALHSLEKEFAGKVKLIYIDPPFNTGKDSFCYNDNFSRSSWLTFMKNRLSVARNLLTVDGNIFIHIDINQSHYLKVLSDYIFGEKNFVEEIIWSYGSPSGGRAATPKPVNIHDYILHYSKNYDTRKQNRVYVPYTERYIKDWFKFSDENGRIYQRRQRGYDENGNAVWIRQYLDESKGIPLSTVWNDIKQVYADPRAYKNNINTDVEVIKEFDGGQKPESLMQRILEMATDEKDIVLDYHLGTGTLAATAHKMGRQYIGVEQMDYIESISCERLKKVIGCASGNVNLLGEREMVDYDNGGISRAVNWHGGGSFVYAELAQKNERAIEEINACRSLNELIALFDSLCQRYFLHYNVHIKEFREEITCNEQFKALTLERQKEMFVRMLDLNQLYTNAADRHDCNTGLTAADIAFTESFYQIRD